MTLDPCPERTRRPRKDSLNRAGRASLRDETPCAIRACKIAAARPPKEIDPPGSQNRDVPLESPGTPGAEIPGPAQIEQSIEKVI
ncbi:hypothetical protein CMUS01_10620 [Colletotrichum musicola]|uniref:Uncharacterized protein n=1 Tax=Colletotrichum musicola TaxID=2175873 RepID=A0A8H6K2K0_9PEZI|nr:hypothetical protein CMUS01_10620 [Colletotrichum musicola]